MPSFPNFIAVVGLFFILYALVLFFFPPKYLNFWYGVNTSVTKKDSNKWSSGQRLFSFAFFAMGVLYTILGVSVNIAKGHKFSYVLLLLVLWIVSKFIVHSFLEKKATA